ncbi:PREDICTED: heat shock 22 kDa protein, mitochondrial-like [Fragaria vesca subsp. vesca]|uniref:heat shock 22 kDa protein, mitochondrial-like n=1 Tax=Fragaria vesca subsp. vesca TaxID=101020 RepID=UPI0002C3727D|nr:PREDICTED: heat shock 22 kDa protein, mitochondrial-like [Fragaria vesca subsp. vesca]
MASSLTLRRLLMPKSLAPISSSTRSITTTLSAAAKHFISTAPADYGDDGEGEWYTQETDKAYYVRLNLPEYEKKDVKVDVDRKENILTVTGRAGHGRHWTSYDLPEECIIDYTKAEMNDGVLKVVVPKVLDEDEDQKSESFSVHIE